MTKKEFRKYLNDTYKFEPNHKYKRFHQLKRGYGDYLYYQDRCKFEVLLMEKNKEEKNESSKWVCK